MGIRSILLSASALLAVAFASSANAALVTKTYDFTLSNFVDPASGAPPPFATISGSFTLTFDPNLNYGNDTADITVNTLSAPNSSPVGFSGGPGGGTPYFVSVGGVLNNAGNIGLGTDDFVLQMRFDDLTNLNAVSLPLCSDPGFNCGSIPGTLASGYTVSGAPNSFWVAETGSVVAVPEPAAWVLMLVGFMGLGVALRHRPRVQLA